MKKQPAHFALQKSKQMTVQTIKEGDVSVEWFFSRRHTWWAQKRKKGAQWS